MAVNPREFMGSFVFGTTNMLADWGIRGNMRDVLFPPKRKRSLRIPSRDGEYDFGAKNYDQRRLIVDADSLWGLSRSDLRELAFILSKRSTITFWNEPEKHYRGEIYDAAQIEYLGIAGHKVVLTFTCDPFAYGKTVSGPMPTIINYAGTAQTPTRIQITNTGTESIYGLSMRIRERRE